MARPSTREEFKQYCLRRLGKPVISINVDDDQLEDRIDDALKHYWDYHYDGSNKVYYSHLLTTQDKQNKYVTIPDKIASVTRILDITGISSRNNMFDIRYQIALNDLYTLTQQSLVPYFMTMQHLQFLENLLVGSKPIRFNRHTNRLNIDMDWEKYDTNTWIIIEGYEQIDPEIYGDVWDDRWLLQYGTALFKRQWGENLKKFGNMQMPGGIVFNGQQIWDEATREIDELEEKMLNDFSLPVGFEIG